MTKKAKKTGVKKEAKVPKKNTITKATSLSNLDSEPLKFDPKSMDTVSVEFINYDTVIVSNNRITDSSKWKEDSSYKEIPKILKAEWHDELSNPEKEINWPQFFLIGTLCLFFYVLGVATSFLYGI